MWFKKVISRRGRIIGSVSMTRRARRLEIVIGQDVTAERGLWLGFVEAGAG